MPFLTLLWKKIGYVSVGRQGEEGKEGDCHKPEWQSNQNLLLLSPLIEAVIFENTFS